MSLNQKFMLILKAFMPTIPDHQLEVIVQMLVNAAAEGVPSAIEPAKFERQPERQPVNLDQPKVTRIPISTQPRRQGRQPERSLAASTTIPQTPSSSPEIHSQETPIPVTETSRPRTKTKSEMTNDYSQQYSMTIMDEDTVFKEPERRGWV